MMQRLHQASLLRLPGLLKGRIKTAHSDLPTSRCRHVTNSAASPPFVKFDTLPCFATSGDHIKVLYDPKDFYRSLLHGIKYAKHRIDLATLYIGKEQTELVEALHQALSRNPKLEVHILADYFRSTREAPKKASSASLLAPLVQAFPNQCRVSLYRTPFMSGLLETLVPKRYNEGWGLWHGKVYCFDDNVLMSGANLSTDYFTNRQDRYIIFEKQSGLADYMHDLLQIFARSSYSLQGSKASYEVDVRWLQNAGQTAKPTDDPAGHAQQSRELIEDFTKNQAAKARASTHGDADTIIQPFLQLGNLNLKQETNLVIPQVLATAEADAQQHLNWTSGYFSVRKGCRESLLACNGPVSIVCAAPESNGFFQSPGFSRYLPPAYTYLERLFFIEVKKRGKQDSLQLREWKRDGWTYHAKGIWLSPSGGQPYLTLVGSSNYGYRSAVRDVEVNSVVQTRSPKLQNMLQQEIENIASYATDQASDELFSRPDRHVGFINRWAAR